MHEADGVRYIADCTHSGSEATEGHVNFIFLDVFNGLDQVPAAFTEAGAVDSKQLSCSLMRLFGEC